MLLAFLVGLAHNRGYLLWFKKEWVTFRYWKKRWFGRYAALYPPPPRRGALTRIPSFSQRRQGEGGECFDRSGRRESGQSTIAWAPAGMGKIGVSNAHAPRWASSQAHRRSWAWPRQDL